MLLSIWLWLQKFSQSERRQFGYWQKWIGIKIKCGRKWQIIDVHWQVVTCRFRYDLHLSLLFHSSICKAIEFTFLVVGKAKNSEHDTRKTEIGLPTTRHPEWQIICFRLLEKKKKQRVVTKNSTNKKRKIFVYIFANKHNICRYICQLFRRRMT